MKNLIEQDQRQIYYFYNENFKDTYIRDNQFQGKGLDYKLKRKVGLCYQWYSEHLTGLTESNKVYLLTDSQKSKQDYLQFLKGDELKLNVITMEDFIVMNSDENPELINYMGFAQQIDIDEELQSKDLLKSESLYDDHQSFDEMVLGIREGKFFKGRLNVSRVNLEEATVTVEGLTDDIVVMGMRNQNRALNGDIVCLQIL